MNLLSGLRVSGVQNNLAVVSLCFFSLSVMMCG